MAQDVQILEIIKVLKRYRTKFVIVGGVCAVLHGAPVTTFDLDLVYSRKPENLGHIEAALTEMDAYYRGHPRILKPDAECLSSPGHHLLMTRLGPLDLLGTIGKNEGYDDLIPFSEEIETEEITLRILSLEHLIRLKEDMLREKDRLILPILRNTLKEKQRYRK
ncbi:hypothetical protein QUF72_00995 [Desulfobacterales bacterium HSG2]|nr:hypothetical protein [Desulfobacterales bacterium HSG2]